MLTRKQLRCAQLVRGLTFDEIVQRTGIPPQSLMALIREGDKDPKDPKKLISQDTFEKVLALLGVDRAFNGLRAGIVLGWRAHKGQRGQDLSWKEAVVELRKAFFSNDVRMVQFSAKRGLFGRQYMLFVSDVAADLRVIVTGADKALCDQLKKVFGAEFERIEQLRPEEFAFQSKLVEHGVYRTVQFDALVGGKMARYGWEDVQAAAKEFDFTTDNLVDLMLVAVTQRNVAVAADVPAEQSYSPVRKVVG